MTIEKSNKMKRLEKSLTKWAKKHAPEIYKNDTRMRAFLLCLRQLLKLTVFDCE